MRHCVTFKPSSCVKVLETMTLTLPTTGCAKKLIFWGFRGADDFNVGLKEYPMDILEKMKAFIRPHPLLHPEAGDVFTPRGDTAIRFFFEGGFTVEGNARFKR